MMLLLRVNSVLRFSMVLAVLIFHAMMNCTGEWLQISPEMYPFMLLGNLALAALLIMFWKSGRQSPPNTC